MANRKKYIFLAAALFIVIAGFLLYNSIPRPSSALSAPWAEALQSGHWYMKCSVRLLNTPEPTPLEMARDGSATFQRYWQEGEAIVTVTREGITQIFRGGELLQETRDGIDGAPDYAGLRDTGKRGDITLAGEQFTYEEYLLGEERLRFLFQGEEFRGLHAGDRDDYTPVAALTADIPPEIQTMMTP